MNSHATTLSKFSRAFLVTAAILLASAGNAAAQGKRDLGPLTLATTMVLRQVSAPYPFAQVVFRAKTKNTSGESLGTMSFTHMDNFKYVESNGAQSSIATDVHLEFNWMENPQLAALGQTYLGVYTDSALTHLIAGASCGVYPNCWVDVKISEALPNQSPQTLYPRLYFAFFSAGGLALRHQVNLP